MLKTLRVISVFLGVAISSLSLAGARICVDQANLRSLDNLETIIDVLDRDTPISSLGREKVSYNGYSYMAVKAKNQSGWVVDSFVCESGSQSPVTARKIVVNITSNKLFYYENGILIDSWNVGTARAGKVTPPGTYSVREKEKCPPYFGSLGDHNVPGCIPENPFGRRVLWFIGNIYGVHGTNQEYLLGPSSTAASRRVSGGCVRNPNAKIEWLFDRVKVGDPVVITR